MLIVRQMYKGWEIMNNFGAYLRCKRKENMTQRELAKKIGVGYPYISKLENNIEAPPSEELLLKLTKVLKLDQDEIFLHANKLPGDIKTLLLAEPRLLKILRTLSKVEGPSFLLNHIEELVNSEEDFFWYLFNKNDRNILLIDPETSEIVDANRKAANFYELSTKKLKNMRITDINILSEKEIFEEMKKAKMALRNYFDFKHRKNNDKIVNVRVKSLPILIKGKTHLYSVIEENKIS